MKTDQRDQTHSEVAAPRRWLSGVAAVTRTVASNPFIAYGSIVLIQLRAIWGVWSYRDLSATDTSFYFSSASSWAAGLKLNPAWSPLDGFVYGSLQRFVHDAFAVTLIYRLLLVFAVIVLVLAILRRLLPPEIAWLVAVWWALLPINFDTTYEVHLMAALPLFAATLVALDRPTRGGRAVVFGILLASGAFVRNEVLLAAGAWLVVWLVVELVALRRGRQLPIRRLVAAAVLPIAAVAALEGVVLARSYVPLGELPSILVEKSTQNVCQVYTFGYEQRHTDFTGSPWTDCEVLMKRDFGARHPTFVSAAMRNPRAFTEHVLWNIHLLPNGLQLMLFNATSGKSNPDYVDRKLGARVVLIPSVVLLGVVLIGAVLLLRDRARYWRQLLRDREWGWIALGCLAVMCAFVILTQRPRPEYLFSLTLLLMAAVGVCLAVINARWTVSRAVNTIAVVVAALLVIVMPGWYGPSYRNVFGERGQSLREAVERLDPAASRLRREQGSFAAGQFSWEICNYVGRDQPCNGVPLEQLVDEKPARDSAEQWLKEKDIGLIYVDEFVHADPRLNTFVAELSKSWQVVSQGPSGSWMLLARPA